MWENNYSKCDKTKISKTQKLKIWQNAETQNVTKLKNSKYEKKIKNSNCKNTQKIKMWQKSKKLQMWQKAKLKMWQNKKNQNVTKLTMGEKKNSQTQSVRIFFFIKNATHIQQLKFYNSKCDKTQELKMGQLKNQKFAKL